MKWFLQRSFWRSPSAQGELARSTAAGYTLTEVIVVVVMISVLAAIAAPSWVALLNRQRLSNATNDVLQALRQAQDEAIRTRYPKQVTLNPGVNPTINVLNEVRRVGQGNVRMQVTPNTVTTITFGATGGPITGPQDVTPDINLPISIAVTVPATGGVRRCVVIETLLGAMRTVNQGENGCS
jgi:prepilin-type N-terminal cleavage/methylation domain-containing protein